MKLDEIKIPRKFAMSSPRESKIHSKVTDYVTNGEIGEIVVDGDGTLIDGYISYVILRAAGVTGDIDVKRVTTYKNMPTVYVWGRHLNSTVDKDYVWRLTNVFIENNHITDDQSLIGRKATVQTKFGIAPIIINKVQYLDAPPIEGRIKKVVALIDEE